MTCPEAVDEALCWGWIDWIKKKVDAERYTNRFTLRKPVSKWSDVNLRTAIHWVMEAKREETRQRRLTRLMETSGAARRLPQLGG